MTLICPVFNLISMFENVLQKHSIEIKLNTGQISVILSYFSFYMYFIFYFVQDM